jgi:hypothetical protein
LENPRDRGPRDGQDKKRAGRWSLGRRRYEQAVASLLRLANLVPPALAGMFYNIKFSGSPLVVLATVVFKHDCTVSLNICVRADAPIIIEGTRKANVVDTRNPDDAYLPHAMLDDASDLN